MYGSPKTGETQEVEATSEQKQKQMIVSETAFQREYADSYMKKPTEWAKYPITSFSLPYLFLEERQHSMSAPFGISRRKPRYFFLEETPHSLDMHSSLA